LARLAPEVALSQGANLAADAQACDLVVAGNTTAALECLRLGTPVAYDGSLDALPRDYNGFVQDGLIPDMSVNAPDMAAVAACYANEWEARMRYFDAAYGQDAQALRARVKAFLAPFLEGA